MDEVEAFVEAIVASVFVPSPPNYETVAKSVLNVPGNPLLILNPFIFNAAVFGCEV